MKRSKKKAIDATEFAASDASLAKARKAIVRYTFVIEPDEELGYVGSARELPGILSDGRTLAECAGNLQFALETALVLMIEQGRAVPAPAALEKRTEQVNVRLTPQEKEILVLESARRGYRGIADLIRAQMIERIAG